MLFGRRTKCSWKSLALLRWWSLLRRIICCHSSFSILFLSSLPLFFLDLFPPLPVEHLIPVLHFLSHPILLFLKLPLFLLLFVFLLLVSLPISLKIPYNTLFLLLLLHSLLLFDHIFMLLFILYLLLQDLCVLLLLSLDLLPFGHSLAQLRHWGLVLGTLVVCVNLVVSLVNPNLRWFLWYSWRFLASALKLWLLRSLEFV